jgi:hypothetical protein
VPQAGGRHQVTKADVSTEDTHVSALSPGRLAFIYFNGSGLVLSTLNGDQGETGGSTSAATTRPQIGQVNRDICSIFVNRRSWLSRSIRNTYHPVGDAFPIAEQVGAGFGGGLG